MLTSALNMLHCGISMLADKPQVGQVGIKNVHSPYTACGSPPHSLKNPTLVRPPPVEAMMSFNTLTPHYEEDVIFALSAADTSRQLGLAGPDAHKARCRMSYTDIVSL